MSAHMGFFQSIFTFLVNYIVVENSTGEDLCFWKGIGKMRSL